MSGQSRKGPCRRTWAPMPALGTAPQTGRRLLAGLRVGACGERVSVAFNRACRRLLYVLALGRAGGSGSPQPGSLFGYGGLQGGVCQRRRSGWRGHCTRCPGWIPFAVMAVPGNSVAIPGGPWLARDWPVGAFLKGGGNGA